MLTPDYQRHWPSYFDAAVGQPPRDTLLRALDAFQHPGAALDIACGEGRDTREMLRRGWSVLATDNSPDALARLGEGPATLLAEMETLPRRLATRTFDLINASFALPFCHEDAFPALWAWIVHALPPGARFAGQFFGDRDEWAAINPRRHHTREHITALLAPFDPEHFDEVEKQGSDAMGGTKRHHVFHVVARKR